MRKRYCETILQTAFPCGCGWGSTTETTTKTCFDEPMEENCINIVDDDRLYCPICGSIFNDNKTR